jgi:hypothetical protein
MKDKCVIYHANCPDGFTGAWLLWRAFGDDGVQYCPANYGDDPPDVVGKDVYIVDFSYPRDVLQDMHSKAASLHVWDHHKTAEKNCQGLDFCTFDMDRCGSRLLFETCIRDNFPGTWWHDKTRDFVQYIDDNDRGVRALPNTDEVRAAYCATPFSFPQWGALVAKGIGEWVRMGRQILDYQQLCIDQHAPTATWRRLWGYDYKVPIVNLTFKHIISPLLGELAEHAPFAAAFWFDGKQWTFSLRSREGGTDVSEVARGFGGGGHKNAAGFRVKNLSDAVQL